MTGRQHVLAVVSHVTVGYWLFVGYPRGAALRQRGIVYMQGQLAIEDGDLVEIDIPNRKLTLHVDDATLAKRRAAWVPYERPVPHGYMRNYRKHVLPASHGAIVD